VPPRSGIHRRRVRPVGAIAHFPHNHRANLFPRHIRRPSGVVRRDSQALSPVREARLRCLITGTDRQETGAAVRRQKHVDDVTAQATQHRG